MQGESQLRQRSQEEKSCEAAPKKKMAKDKNKGRHVSKHESFAKVLHQETEFLLTTRGHLLEEINMCREKMAWKVTCRFKEATVNKELNAILFIYACICLGNLKVNMDEFRAAVCACKEHCLSQITTSMSNFIRELAWPTRVCSALVSRSAKLKLVRQ